MKDDAIHSNIGINNFSPSAAPASLRFLEEYTENVVPRLSVLQTSLSLSIFDVIVF
jgi:hypothetical protein